MSTCHTYKHNKQSQTADLPILRWNITSIVVVVLQKTQTIEYVHHKSDWWKLHVDPSTRLSGFVVDEGYVCVGTDLKLGRGRGMGSGGEGRGRGSW